MTVEELQEALKNLVVKAEITGREEIICRAPNDEFELLTIDVDGNKVILL